MPFSTPSFAARSHDEAADAGQHHAVRVSFSAFASSCGISSRSTIRVLTAAVLHDTIEDTKTDFDDIAERYGPEVAQWVALLSKDKRKEEKEREEAYVAGLDAAPWQVKACKLADLVDNMLDMETMPAEKRKTSKRRYRAYWAAFRKWSEPELRGILEIVEGVVDATV